MGALLDGPESAVEVHRTRVPAQHIEPPTALPVGSDALGDRTQQPPADAASPIAVQDVQALQVGHPCQGPVRDSPHDTIGDVDEEERVRTSDQRPPAGAPRSRAG